jgi:hypothetical protein
LPREPSTPRITLWRNLRRLGVAQVSDGVVALPLDARTREQLEWLAEDVVEHGGDASLWLAEPGSAAQERALARQMADAVTADYRRIEAEARAARSGGGSEGDRRRSQGRLRRELHRVSARDYFPAGAGDRARVAVDSILDAEAVAG